MLDLLASVAFARWPPAEPVNLLWTPNSTAWDDWMISVALELQSVAFRSEWALQGGHFGYLPRCAVLGVLRLDGLSNRVGWLWQPTDLIGMWQRVSSRWPVFLCLTFQSNVLRVRAALLALLDQPRRAVSDQLWIPEACRLHREGYDIEILSVDRPGRLAGVLSYYVVGRISHIRDLYAT